LTPADLKGVIPAVVTPFHQDGRLDLESFDALVDFVLAAGVGGLALLGTTGESPTVPWLEVEALLSRALARRSAGSRPVPIIVGTGTSDTAESCRRTERARALGADAALIVTPYYSRPSAAGVRAHFEAIAEVGLPLVGYHIPYRTGLALSVDDLLSILNVPGVIGLKESSGGVATTLALTARTDRAILCGEDPLLLPALACGAAGGILAAANVVPAQLVALMEAHEQGEPARARALAHRLAPVMELLYREPNPCPLKAALHGRGLIASPYVRPPLAAASKPLAAALEQALAALGGEPSPG
jgi:4-hydroxy-tetrahydrodipicolinate synthase